MTNIRLLSDSTTFKEAIDALESLSFIPKGTGTVSRLVNDKLNDVVSVLDFGATPDNPDCSTAFTNVMAWADSQRRAGSSPCILVPAGVYRYSTSPNFGVSNVSLECSPGTVFQHTGSGVAFLLDGGTSSAAGDLYRFRLLGSPTISGNPNTTYGLDIRGANHCTVDATVSNAATAGTRIRFAVSSKFYLRTTGLGAGGFSVTPIDGLILDQRNANEGVSDCTFYTTVMEQCSGIGIKMINAGGCLFLGGTAEANTGGNLNVGANCYNNIFIGLDMEFSAQYDVECFGSFNKFISCYSDNLFATYADSNSVTGGTYNRISVNGNFNSFEDLRYAAAGGDFEIGNVVCYKKNIHNASTGVNDPDRLAGVIGNAIANVTDLATTIAAVNALLAQARADGRIAH